jgi:hypothetical protein
VADHVSNLLLIAKHMDTQATNGVLEDFRLEFSQCWPRIPNKLPFFILLGAWIVLFHFLGNSTLGYVRTPSLFGFLYDAYSGGGRSLVESEEGYAVLVPPVVAFCFGSGAANWSR